MSKNIILTDLRNNKSLNIGKETKRHRNTDGSFNVKTDKGYFLEFIGDKD